MTYYFFLLKLNVILNFMLICRTLLEDESRYNVYARNYFYGLLYKLFLLSFYVGLVFLPSS